MSEQQYYQDKGVILVVEDDEGLNKLIRKQLERIGLKTLGALDGSETISYLKEHNDIILLILDYKLQNSSGSELVDTLIENDLIVPFIIITGHGDERIAVEMMKKGAKDYLVKDVNFLDLLPNVIKQVVNELATRKELDDTKKALKDYETKYLKLIETSPDAIAVTDKNVIIRAANMREADLFDLEKPEQLKGKNLRDFVHPADRSFFDDRLSSIESFKPDDFPLTFEHRILNVEKDILFVEVSLSASMNSENEIEEIVFASRDITERILSNEKLKQSEEKFRSFVENAGDIIISLTKMGYFIYVSPNWKRILGHTVQDVVGKHYKQFIHQDDLEAFATFLKKASDSSIRNEYIEFRILHNSGIYRWHTMTASLIKNQKFEHSLFLGITRDITEKKEYEKNLIEAKEIAEQASKLKSSLLANMSHELRTPLNGILGFAQVLMEELEDETHNHMIGKIHKSAKRLMTTLNSILDLSLLETSEQFYESDIININEEMISICNDFQYIAADKGLLLDIRDEKDPLPIHVGARYFKQIISNLLDNALKFTKEGGITVSAEKIQVDNEYWGVVHVTDTGIGIDKKDHDIIFQEFRQVSEGFSRNFEGTGLGLTIVHKIVKKLRGVIEFESSLGVGTTFSVRFPLAELGEKEVPADKEATTVKEEDILSQMPRALLVEDNEINRDIVTLYLTDICEVEAVKDGETAVEYAEKNSYDLILMDINLGKGINGLEAANRIRKLNGYEKTPIVAITGYALAGDKAKLLEQGMTHYLAKPFQKEELNEIITSILKRDDN